jgi:SAM-dependent methyltransferase
VINPISEWIRKRSERHSQKAERQRLASLVLAAVQTQYPRFDDMEQYCAEYSRALCSEQNSRTLDLGCGTTPRNPFGARERFGVDIREDAAAGIKYADLAVEPIPYPDKHFSFVTAYDFFEHVPRTIYAPRRRFPFVDLMNEIHRVLEPGGVLLSHTPAYPFPGAFQDPTHVNIITEQTFPLYFDDTNLYARMYGFNGAFEILKQGWRSPHLITVLRKVAPVAQR